MGCEIADDKSTWEHMDGDLDAKEKKTIYLHLKKFFRGTRFTSQSFLRILQEKHRVGDIVCVSGKVSIRIYVLIFQSENQKNSF